MVSVELTPFVAFREEHWTDDDLRALQSFLLVSPDAGDLIRGGAGLRKLRWSAQVAESAAARGSSTIGRSPSTAFT